MAVDQIGTKALVDCSVAAADIAPGTITSAKLAGSIANAKLSNSSITVNGTTIALGASGAVPPVQWQSVVVSDGSTVTTMVAGRGYFVNNTSAAGIVKLPASATAGDIVSIKDYAGNFGTNNLTIQRNGHNIQGNAVDSEISTNRASVTLVYVDATKGWLYTNESNVGNLTGKYVTATGGTVTTSGNDKIHTFTGDSNFVVSCGGNVGGSNKVSYFVLGGGGGGGAPQSSNRGGGGGGGGFREGKAPAFNSYTSSPSPIVAPDGLAVPAATYPITVGGGGNGGTGQANVANPGQIGTNGSASIFSTITSAGGGGGGGGSPPSTGTIFPGQPGGNGGGGGGGGTGPGTCARGGGEGNTPPVSPAQGSKGGAGGLHPGNSSPPDNAGGGGGGISARGGSTRAPAGGGHGGDGATTEITASSVAYGGGGAGIGSCSDGNAASGGIAAGSNGTANRGMGGPPGSAPAGAGKNGGSGIVVIRYKYQN